MNIIKDWRVYSLGLFTVATAEFIGTVKLGVILLLPMIFAMLIGGLISLPKFKILNEKQMKQASIAMSVVLMLLVARFSLAIGPQLNIIKQASTALLVQELGHFAGTILLGLPLAVALGMGREAIGATYSIGRENNIAIIDNKYSLDSPEGRGVMAMYIIGTLFGAIIVSIIASLFAKLDILNPLALAMGAGVGSGSMMTAATGSILEFYPELKEEITAIALTANTLSSLLGMYIYIWISLPLAEKLYGVFKKLFRRQNSATSFESTATGD
ncbi:DUF3100 domain-containing protein [Thorsellia kenyensis]|uniref:DUF3100 domain-containing protein n=1 Tax=Thorsellia kenyensis TaxID=1549888 RepID=A0ABV6C7G2_9GAMM